MSKSAELVSEISFPRRLRHAVSQQKANPLKLLSDVVQLGRGPNRLNAAEYFLYRPWDANTGEDTRTFLGSDGAERINASWIGGWADLTRDTLAMNALLQGFELPTMETQAVFGPRSFPHARQLASRDDVLTFLRDEARYPLVCESSPRNAETPVTILGFNSESDELQLESDTAICAENFVAQLVDRQTSEAPSILFRTLFQPHEELAKLCNGRGGTMRFHCLSDQHGIEILRVSWRIPCGETESDSLLLDSALLAGVDPETGEVTHAISLGDYEYDAIEQHPDTGASLEGYRIPGWSDVCGTVLRAAHAVSDCLVQGWDVAISADGPVILGLHAGGGDPMRSQLGYSKGILDGRYAEFAQRALKSHKHRRKNNWAEMKGNMAQQMSNLQFDAASQEAAGEAKDSESSDDQAFQIDTEAKTDFSFSQRMLNAVAQHNANLVTIISDVAKLSRTPNRLPPYEYFLYQLWDEARFDLAAKQTFVGSDGWVRINMAMPNMWRELAEDKLALAAFLRAHDLPIPETQAIYHTGRHFPGAEQLTSPEQVQSFLRERARYPLFGKPVGGQQSLGAVGMECYDEASDSLQLTDGSTVSVDEFVRQITVDADSADAYGNIQLGAGYLFQTQLRPHPRIAETVGQRTGTVRMVCVADDQGVELVRASWKIPAGPNVADNLWRTGNMLGGIDLETGTLTHVVKPGAVECERVAEHPDSSISFEDFQFPEWQAMCDVVTKASRLIQNCTFQGWDVALCEDGPVLVELQAGGGNPVLAQLGYDRGLLQGRYLEHVNATLRRGRGRS